MNVLSMLAPEKQIGFYTSRRFIPFYIMNVLMLSTRSMFDKRYLIRDIVYNFGKFKRH